MNSITAFRVVTLILLSVMQMRVCNATSITEVYVPDNTGNFRFVITGGDFDTSDNHAISGGTNWTLTANIAENAGFINDSLVVSRGTAVHVNPPDGEGFGTPFNFSFTANADGKVTGTYAEGPIIMAIPHGVHTDTFTALLQYSVVSNLGGLQDITSWTLTVSGPHSGGGPGAPAPDGGSTLGLLLLGITGLVSVQAVRRNTQNRLIS